MYISSSERVLNCCQLQKVVVYQKEHGSNFQSVGCHWVLHQQQLKHTCVWLMQNGWANYR